MGGSKRRRGGVFTGWNAESLTVSRTRDNADVVVMLDALTNDPDAPVVQVFYRASPQQAREIADRLVANAAAAERGES